MSRHTTFRIGGPAEVLVYPSDEEDLLAVLRYASAQKIPCSVIGGGSKLLVSDRGVRGFVISLDAPAFCKTAFAGETVDSGCGIKLCDLIKKASEKDLGGLEFLAGIPGTLGGALVMNAGWPAKAIGNLVKEVSAVKGLEKITLGKDDLEFSYRSSNLQDIIVVSARLKLEKKPKENIDVEMKKNLEKKRQTQELGFPSVGSVFLNPSGKTPAWELISRCGLKGRKTGGAEVSEKHANFIINRGKASAADVKALIDEIQKIVFKEHQIMLKLEAKLWGDLDG